MSPSLQVRQAEADDLDQLQDLYLHLTPNNLPVPNAMAKDIFARFLKYDGSAILLGEVDGTLVSSCTLVIIPNLTRQGTSYALIENVVTNADHRGQGYGKLMLDAATDLAWAQGCYKVMLLAGSKDKAIISFYEGAGFKQSKTGFQKRRSTCTASQTTPQASP